MSGHQDREADRIVQAVIDNRLQHIDRSAGILAEDDAFFVCDLGEVYRRHSEWVERLTRITPHYGRSALFQLRRLCLIERTLLIRRLSVIKYSDQK